MLGESLTCNLGSPHLCWDHLLEGTKTSLRAGLHERTGLWTSQLAVVEGSSPIIEAAIPIGGRRK